MNTVIDDGHFGFYDLQHSAHLFYRGVVLTNTLIYLKQVKPYLPKFGHGIMVLDLTIIHNAYTNNTIMVKVSLCIFINIIAHHKYIVCLLYKYVQFTINITHGTSHEYHKLVRHQYVI